MIHRRHALALLALLVLTACGGGGGGGEFPSGPFVVYAAIGASDAVGIGASPRSNGYVPVFAERLDASGPAVALRNLGVSGAWADEMLADQVPAAIAANPEVVTVWTGSNDLVGGEDPAAFGAVLDAMLRRLTDETDAVILVGNLVAMTETPRFRDGSDPNVTEDRVNAFNAEIADAVAAHRCVLVNLFVLEVRDDLFWIDGFHPNNAGYQQLADAYWRAYALLGAS